MFSLKFTFDGTLSANKMCVFSVKQTLVKQDEEELKIFALLTHT